MRLARFKPDAGDRLRTLNNWLEDGAAVGIGDELLLPIAAEMEKIRALVPGVCMHLWLCEMGDRYGSVTQWMCRHCGDRRRRET